VQPLPTTAEAGTRLDERYRLDAVHRTGPGSTLWRATDEVLGRTVAVRIVDGRTTAQGAAIAAAAGRAGRVSDARWVRVLDVGSTPSGRRSAVWVVVEWVDGPSLADVVRQEPLRPEQATTVVLSCARAVAAAARSGASHGGLHPDEVLLPADGAVRLTGLELAGLAGEADPVAGSDGALRRHDDVRGLGGLLYAALTGRWPLPGWSGLPPPSRGDGVHPRRQRGGVSRELDEVTARALTGGYTDVSALLQALSLLPATPLNPPAPDDEDSGDPRWRRVAWRVVPPLLIVGVGLGAWAVGRDLGRVPRPAQAAAGSFPQPHQHGAGTHGSQVVWSRPPKVTSFDPQGDGAEDPGGVGLAVDDDPSTQWTTDTYHDNPHFGGLKDGVGLLLDLGRPKTVAAARLLLSAPGASVQIRAGAHPPQQASDLPVVASRTDGPSALTLSLRKPVTARYWLVWFTSLPKAGSDYRLGVGEIALQH
jgi:hypothetical protein